MSKSGAEDKSFKARVVYDFEAADDKELTIKEGELVVVTDDSDSNWWKGSNHRGNGVFPSSFVSKDIESRGLTGAVNNSNSSKRSSAVKESEKSYLVRALYDFEAAEDNELTFKAGEMIVVIDDSNENWWKGSNERGDGLFPANFVTTELNDEHGDDKNKGNERRRSVQFNEEVNVKILEKDPEPVTIDEEKIDKLIHLLHEADPTGEEIDSEDLIALEEQCSMMSPLIDAELEKVDKRISQLNEVNASLVEAMNMYRSLMPQDNYAMQYSGYIPPGQIPPGQMQGPNMYGYNQQTVQQPIQGNPQQPTPPTQVQLSPGQQQPYHQQHPPGQMPPSPNARHPQNQMYPQQQQPIHEQYQQQQPSYGMYQHNHQTNQPPQTMINGNDGRNQHQQ